MERENKTYGHALEHIQPADLLLYRGTGIVSRVVSIASMSAYTHAAKVSVLDGSPYVVEIRELIGGRITSLRKQVATYPGRIDYYRANPDDRWPNYNRLGADRYMRDLTDYPYGLRHLWTAAMCHLPVVRIWFGVPSEEDVADGHPPFCSDACSLADRIGGGVDPVLHTSDRQTKPSDLARSHFYQYQFTLIP